MTEKEQRLRNEVGQLTHKVGMMTEQRKQMQIDLNWQRDDMAEAIKQLEAENVRDAISILRDCLDRRERTRQKRIVKA